MSKNPIQFQEGYSLIELFENYGTEKQCTQALFNWKWPTGFICPECGSTKYCTLKSRKVYQCNHCHHQTSLISGTIFENTKLPLPCWFLGIHLVTQSKTGISALELKRQVKISYNSAWTMKQKIMQVMRDRNEQQVLSGTIQLDDVFWGGEHQGGTRGRGSENKVPLVAAVSTNDEGHPIAMNLHVIDGFRSKSISNWAKKHILPGSLVVSDGLPCFNAVADAGCEHIRIVTGGGPQSVTKEEFTWVNTMIGNVKKAVSGTYHAVRRAHLQRYLAEFCYRFNRRFQLKEMLARFCYVAMRTPPMPAKLLSMAESYG